MTVPSSSTVVYQITLLRHAEGARGMPEEPEIYHLTERGKSQAKAIAESWLAEGVTYHHILSSPLDRARETAEIIAPMLGLSLQVDPCWTEFDPAPTEKVTAQNQQQGVSQPRLKDQYHPAYPGGESYWSCYLRAGQALQALLSRSPDAYLVVSHANFLNFVLYAILGISPQPNFYAPRFNLKYGSFAKVLYYPEKHTWHLMSLNNQPLP